MLEHGSGDANAKSVEKVTVLASDSLENPTASLLDDEMLLKEESPTPFPTLNAFLDRHATQGWGEKKLSLLFFALIFLADSISALLLYGATAEWDVSPTLFFKGFVSFNRSTSDLIILCFLRSVIVPALVVLGIVLGSRNDPDGNGDGDKGVKPGDVLIDIHGKRMGGADENPHLSGIVGATSLSNSGEISKKKLQKDKEAEEGKRERLAFRKKAVMGCVYAILTLCQITVGIKAVLFTFRVSSGFNYFFAGLMMGVSVLVMNIELYLANELINSLTSDIGIMFKSHPHPLFPSQEGSRWCDNCRVRIGLNLRGYRCPTCDYDLCDTCSKKSKAGAEGQLRTDKGPVEEEDISNWEYVKRASVYVRPHWHIIGIAFVFLILASILRLIMPNYQGKIMDNIIKEEKSEFKTNIIIYLCSSIFLGIFGAITNLCFNLAGVRIINIVRTILFQSIIKQDVAFFDGSATGDLTSRLGENIRAMIAPIQSMMNTLLSSGFQLLGGLFMCMLTSWRLSILAFTTIGPVTLLYNEYSEWSRNVHTQIWSYVGESSSIATQAISNVRTVKAFGNEPKETSKFNEILDGSLKMGEKDSWASAGTYALTNYLELCLSILILWYGGNVAMEEPNVLSIGNLITFQLYWNMMRNSFANVTNIWSSFTKAGGAAQRIMSLLSLKPAISNDEGIAIQKEDVKGDIVLENLNFHYQMRPENKVLKGINLTVPSGKVCALVGKSGGGKSTLIQLLMRFYDPIGGSISLDGTDIRDFNPINYRSIFGLVSQDTELFNTTIEKNIAYGVDHYTEKELVEAAQFANCHDFIMSFGDKYQTIIGDKGMRISGGQKQRIALARVFLRKPKILLLDEATSALDSESEAFVQQSIDKLIAMRDCTVFLVAHRLSTVINADLIAVIHNGAVHEQGNHDELVAKGGVYAKLVEIQTKRMANSLVEPPKQGDAPLDQIDSIFSDVEGTSKNGKSGSASPSAGRGGFGAGQGRGGRGGRGGGGNHGAKEEI